MKAQNDVVICPGSLLVPVPRMTSEAGPELSPCHFALFSAPELGNG